MSAVTTESILTEPKEEINSFFLELDQLLLDNLPEEKISEICTKFFEQLFDNLPEEKIFEICKKLEELGLS